MIIQCINCSVKYNIDESKINPPGKKVKCSKCGELFFVEIKAEETPPQNQSEINTELNKDKTSEPPSAKANQNDIETPVLDGPQKEKDSEFKLTDNTETDEIPLSIDLTDETETGDEEKTLLDESPSQKEFEEEKIVVEKEDTSSETAEDENPDTQPEQPASIDTSFEEAAAFDEKEKPDSDLPDDNLELEDKDIVDWESLEVDNIEESVEVANRKGLTDSNAEIPEGDLEIDESRKKIKEERKKRESQNPFRSPSLAPDLSDAPSSYHRVSDSVADDDSRMEVASTKSENQKVYTSQASGNREKRGFLSRFFVNLTIVVVLAILFTAVFFSLITFGVIPKETLGKYTSLMSKYLPALEDENERRLKKISVRDLSGKWINSRNGYLFVVYGEVINNSNKSVSYIKLRSKYFSAGADLYTQEFYSGNTLTLKELKNGSVSALEKKLGKKTGDVDFDDVDSLAGRNFNIEPGKSVPFYTFYLSKRKILGLKYDIDVVDFESGNI